MFAVGSSPSVAVSPLFTNVRSAPAAVGRGSIDAAPVTGGVEQLSRNANDKSVVYGDPRVQARQQQLQQSVKAKQQAQQVQQTQQVQKLAARDREVRTHEQAHQAAGGQYAGSVSYQFTRGPNGVSYAVGGEVPISTGKEATPEATLLKAQMVRRAALAPAEPSGADRAVAAEASKLETEALAELSAKRLHPNESEGSETPEKQDKTSESGDVPGHSARRDAAQYLGAGDRNQTYSFHQVV